MSKQWATSSHEHNLGDERIKTNIQDLDLGLATVLNLRPRTFDYTRGYNNNKTNNIGFVAQEVEDLIPQAVRKIFSDYDENEQLIGDFRILDTGPMIPILVKALQEAVTKIETLEARIEALES